MEKGLNGDVPKGLKSSVFGTKTRYSHGTLVWVELSLILPLVFDQGGVIFTVLGVLFFVNRMYPATVFPVSMRMVHLNLAVRVKALGKIGNAVAQAHVQIERVDVMNDAAPSFRRRHRIVLDLK